MFDGTNKNEINKKQEKKFFSLLHPCYNKILNKWSWDFSSEEMPCHEAEEKSQDRVNGAERDFISLPSNASKLPGSDANCKIVQSVSCIAIQNRQTKSSPECSMCKTLWDNLACSLFSATTLSSRERNEIPFVHEWTEVGKPLTWNVISIQKIATKLSWLPVLETRHMLSEKNIKKKLHKASFYLCGECARCETSS